jgi:DNA-binding transcriptional LysR family regulator
MKLDTLGVQAFVAIAESASFVAAARQLHISQTALSRRLLNFEALLGVTLVERTTRSVALTQVGAAFLPQARRLVSDLTAALVEIKETGKAQRGDICIACVPTASAHFLPAIIQRYAQLYPRNRIKILDHTSFEVASAVLAREAEFGINIAAPQHEELDNVPLMDDPFVVICRDDHPLAGKRKITWNALQAYPLVFQGYTSANRALLEAALAAQSLQVRPFYEVEHSSTAIGLVSQGLGPAVIPRLAVQTGTYPQIRVLALIQPVITRSVVLTTRRGAHLSPAAAALHAMIVGHALSFGHGTAR